MSQRKHQANRKTKPTRKPRGPKPRRRKAHPPGPIARGRKKTLSSHTVGALPIVNRYVKKIATRFDLEYRIDDARVAEEARGDGLFPLVTNVLDLSEQEILWCYKRQPTIEKRFEQLKTDYEVAPVYLKEVRRIQALLCLYFLALLVEALLERELRQAMERESLESLPLYPEGRPCRCPTTRRLLDVFEIVQRHTLEADEGQAEVLVTELSDLQRKLLKLLGLPSRDYGR
jgi:hypothetical protein